MTWNLLTRLRLAILSVVLTGCGSGSIAPTQLTSSQHAYDRGLAAFAGGSHSQALTDFTIAIKTPGLTPDMLVDAILKRAHCHAEAGDFEKAMEDIDRVEKGAMEMDKVFLARSFVYKKKGDQAGAQSEFKKARKIDPRATLP